MNPMVSAFQRWGYLLAMGAFLAIVLQADSREIRLYAAVGLIFFAQLREISLLSEVEPVRIKKKEKFAAPAAQDPTAHVPSVFEEARKSYASTFLSRIRGGADAAV